MALGRGLGVEMKLKTGGFRIVGASFLNPCSNDRYPFRVLLHFMVMSIVKIVAIGLGNILTRKVRSSERYVEDHIIGPFIMIQ